MGTRCWLRAGDLAHGWTMLMWCEEVPCAFFVGLSMAPRTWTPFFVPSSSSHIVFLSLRTMDSNHQHTIHWARQTAASRRHKLKKTTSLSAQHFFCFHIFRLNTVWKRVSFLFFFQSLFIHLCFKDVFLFTSNSTQMRHLVESRVWVLAWYSNKKKAAYNNSHMKCHNSPSCMRHWLLTHSDTWALFSAENIFEFMDWQQNLLSCLMTVFIVNGFFVTEEGAGTLWLRDVVHSSCSHSHFIHSGQTTPMTTSLWPEAPHVLFITIKSAGPNVTASSLAGTVAPPG